MRRMIDMDAAEIRALSAKVVALVERHGSTADASRETGISIGVINLFRRLADTRVNRTFSTETIDKIKRSHVGT